MLEDFFDSLSVCMEAEELYDEYAEDRSKRAALKMTKTQLLRDYKGERDMTILSMMSVYWLHLRKSLQEPALKEALSNISEEEIRASFSPDDADSVLASLRELVNAEPDPRPKRKGRCKSVSASWKEGDVYAYRLDSDEAKSAGLAEKYVLIYVFDNEKVPHASARFFALIHDSEGMESSVEDILKDAVFIKHLSNGNYRYVLIDDEDDYPTEKLRYLGNVFPVKMPLMERVPPTYHYYRYTLWRDFEECMVSYIRKYVNSSDR